MAFELMGRKQHGTLKVSGAVADLAIEGLGVSFTAIWLRARHSGVPVQLATDHRLPCATQ
jgi:hypothetical protein